MLRIQNQTLEKAKKSSTFHPRYDFRQKKKLSVVTVLLSTADIVHVQLRFRRSQFSLPEFPSLWKHASS